MNFISAFLQALVPSRHGSSLETREPILQHVALWFLKQQKATNQHVCTKSYMGRGGCLPLLVLACHQPVLSAKQQLPPNTDLNFCIEHYLQALDHTGSAIVKHDYWHRNCTALKGVHNTTSQWQMPTRAHKSKIGCPLRLHSQHFVLNHQWNCILQIKLKPV